MNYNNRVSSRDPFAGRIRAAVGSLNSAASTWRSADSQANYVESDVRSADSEFSTAEYAASRASNDDENNDASWDGRDLASSFRSGGRDLNSVEGGMGSARRELHSVGTGINRVGSDLDQLRKDLQQAKDARFQAVTDAMIKLSYSNDQALSVDAGWKSVSQSAGRASREAGNASYDIQQIVSDEPGKDVSSSGRAVENTVRSIQYKIDDMESALSNSTYSSSNGQRDLQQAIQFLQNTLY